MFNKGLSTVGLSLLLALTVTGCGGSSSDSSPDEGGSDQPPVQQEIDVSGVVRDYYTGEPVPGASVDITSADGTKVAGSAGEDGRFTLSVNRGIARISVNADADGYAESSSIASTLDNVEPTGLELSLLPANSIQTFSASTSTNLPVDELNVVELGANAFVLPDGTVYSGDVDAEITIVDPTSDPSVMPGGYEAVGADGTEGLMESWGAITANFESESGENLQLGQGQIATIRIPLAQGRAAATSPATIPLFYYDDQEGVWREEGAATLVTENGISFYQGTVEHFTTWNADYLYESVDVIGRVVDESGDPVADALVTSQGQDYIGSSSVRTANDGTFHLPVRPNSDVLIAASRNGLSNTTSISVGDTDFELGNDIVLSEAAVSITLTWGENPEDLDTHFFGPENENGSSEFEVYYGNQSVSVNGTLINLDVDDTTSFGPEVTTVPRFPYPGTYRYLVYLFSGSGTIEDSPARVEVSIGGETSVFSPTQAQGTATDWWAVVNFVVDSEFNVTLQPVQEWRDFGANPAQATVSPSALGVMEGNENPAQAQVERKYYAR